MEMDRDSPHFIFGHGANLADTVGNALSPEAAGCPQEEQRGVCPGAKG